MKETNFQKRRNLLSGSWSLMFGSSLELGGPLAIYRSWCLELCFVLTLLLTMPTAKAQLPPNSPVGEIWDCVISGSRQGIAYLTFSSDDSGGAFSGLEILVPKTASAQTMLITGDYPSNGLGLRNHAGPANFSLFGFTGVDGPWAFDSKGRIIGSFLEVAAEKPVIVCSTNENITTVYQSTTVAVTNANGSISYFYTNITTFITNAPTITCVTNPAGTGFTNTVNFVGKVVPGKRLTLAASSSLGRITFRGVPSVSLLDLSGSWYGIKKQNQISSFEFFGLTTLLDALNTYQVDGRGPGYSYSEGFAILSSQKKIVFAFDIFSGGDYRSTRAVIGSFNFRNARAATSGIDSPPGPLTNRVNFQVTKRTSLP